MVDTISTLSGEEDDDCCALTMVEAELVSVALGGVINAVDGSEVHAGDEVEGAKYGNSSMTSAVPLKQKALARIRSTESW